MLKTALTTTLLAALLVPAGAAVADGPTSIRLVSTSLRVDDDRRVAVKVRCSSQAPCRGVLELRVGNGTDRHPKRYRVAGRTTATIRVGITPTAKRKIMDGDGVRATVTLNERDGGSLERRLPICV